jgi:DNA polymerase
VTWTIDFETYSEAGNEWDGLRWVKPKGAQKRGLSAVGAAAYAQHPTTEILCLSYRRRGEPVRRWRPGMPPPAELWATDEPLEAHNVMFERLIWTYVSGWPAVDPARWRCSMATARVINLPGKLEKLGEVLHLDVRKDADGDRLIKKFAMPRNPTLKDKRLRIRPEEDPEDGERLYSYCDTDVLTESAAVDVMPPMTEAELRAWRLDQAKNWRGVGIDVESVNALITVVERHLAEREVEFTAITGGIGPGQLEAVKKWLRERHGVTVGSLDEEGVTEALARPGLPDPARRALEIRAETASASVKKLYAMRRMVTPDGRLKNLYNHHGARTGRPTGQDTQATNMPRGGPNVRWCRECKKPSGLRHFICAWCLADALDAKRKWSHAVVEVVLEAIPMIPWVFFGEVLHAVAGCLRGVFVAAPGHDLICSDYTAIEAVVLAALAGEQWRLEAFARGDDIYLASIARIKGVPLQFYLDYAAAHGEHHPDRQDGKTRELAGGYGGGVGSMRAFGAEGTDEELQAQVYAWRDASPAIVGFWRDLEDAFVAAAQDEWVRFYARPNVSFRRIGGCVWLRLPSGREIAYHNVELAPHPWRRGAQEVSYWGWNTNTKKGKVGWIRMRTYGGSLAENVTQAVAHDIQRHGIENLANAGYPMVMDTYDEDIAEVPQGFGSVEEFEALMTDLPEWAKGWPIRAAGGWRGRRYRKG